MFSPLISISTSALNIWYQSDESITSVSAIYEVYFIAFFQKYGGIIPV